MKSNELSERLFKFAARVILFTRILPEDAEYKVIKYQLVKSAGSVGANYEEAQSASSSADFTYKVEISLREIRESNYWLRLLNEITSNKTEKNSKETDFLIDESDQLKKILGSIVFKVKNKNK
ncbi:MAG: four helix bundle protein [Bacteroidetes bacterium]|nr:MAG: four helix bundle protein [Bacteroidota bacterium]